jgi:hypothetical protein
MKGSVQVDFGAFGGVQFSYRNVKFREAFCLFNPGVFSGTLNYRFDRLLFAEFDGTNGNRPDVFTNPVCAAIMPSVNAPYGTWAQSTASFILFGMPTGGVGLPSPDLMIGPNESIVTSAGAPGPGRANFAANAGGIVSNNLTQSGCFVVEFTWVPSSLAFQDKITGMWHYLWNSDELNQYWVVSTDEMNAWQSRTVGTDGGLSSVYTLPASVDYALLLSTREAQTAASLATNGLNQNGPYYQQTENMSSPLTVGFDVGRGSEAISFNGSGGTKTGVAFGGLGNGNQDPAYGGKAPQLGFVTWDNKSSAAPAGVGSTRLTWLSIDLGGFLGLSPDADLDVTKLGGTVRVPMLTNLPAGGPIQPVTQLGFSSFVHTTGLAPSGWPDPSGITPGAFNVNASAGGSLQVATAGFSSRIPCNIGIGFNITYGTTGLAPGLTFDPSVADVSGTRQLFVLP